MKRLSSLIACLLLLISMTVSFVSCDRDYDEKEVIAAAKELLLKAHPLNVIYYGEGLKYDETQATSHGVYKEVFESELEKYGFSTLDELKKMTREVFTEGYASEIIRTRLEAVKDENENIIHISRYIKEIKEEPVKDEDGNITVVEKEFIYANTQYDVYFDNEIYYDLNSVRVKDVDEEKLIIAVSVTVTSKEGETQTREKTFTLIEEANGWRIDSPTYSVYSKYKDRYDELDKEFEK